MLSGEETVTGRRNFLPVHQMETKYQMRCSLSTSSGMSPQGKRRFHMPFKCACQRTASNARNAGSRNRGLSSLNQKISLPCQRESTSSARAAIQALLRVEAHRHNKMKRSGAGSYLVCVSTQL